MAIGSNILFVDSKTGKVREIYNHMSSHLMYTGRVLHEFYSTEDKLENLFQHGDVYCIGYTADPIPEDKMNDEIYKNGCNHSQFYIRDRFELPGKKREARVFENLEAALNQLDKKPSQFTYIFKDGKWSFRTWRRRKLEEMTVIRIYHDEEEDG